MCKRALLDIEARLPELDDEELRMLRTSVDDMLRVYGAGANDGDEPAQKHGYADDVLAGAAESTDYGRRETVRMAELVLTSFGVRAKKLN
jgi:hypothetical protein